jgi:hypothetical protein
MEQIQANFFPIFCIVFRPLVMNLLSSMGWWQSTLPQKSGNLISKTHLSFSCSVNLAKSLDGYLLISSSLKYLGCTDVVRFK